MTIAELKLKIFKQIDSLEKSRLEELYGFLKEMKNKENNHKDWESLTKEQKTGIFDAIDELDSGKGVSHEKVIEKIPKKYLHA